jgi:hypothetical protein
LAAEWLEKIGEKDALTLADHFERGGLPKRAVPWLVQGVQTALDGGNYEACLGLCDRALANGTSDAERGALIGTRATILGERGDLHESLALRREAMALCPVDSVTWQLCAAYIFRIGVFLGDPSVTAPVLQAVASAQVPPTPTGPYGWVLHNSCFGLAMIGQIDSARALLERAEAAELGVSECDPTFVLSLRMTRGYWNLMNGDLASAFSNLTEARLLGERMHFMAPTAICLLVSFYAEAGDLRNAEKTTSDLRAMCEPNGLRGYSDRGAFFLARAYLDAQRSADAVALLRPLEERIDRQIAVSARAALAEALIAIGDCDEAGRQARTALEEGSMFPSVRQAASAALALIELHRNEPEAALAFAEQALDDGAGTNWLRLGSVLRLARAEALHALGNRADAHRAIREGRDRILAVAATLEEMGLSRSYLTNVRANSRTLALARAWLECSSETLKAR